MPHADSPVVAFWIGSHSASRCQCQRNCIKGQADSPLDCCCLQGSAINLVGIGATLLGLQATVGLLVAKTLTNATANPFLSGEQGSYNPVLALDVFLVQVTGWQHTCTQPALHLWHRCCCVPDCMHWNGLAKHRGDAGATCRLPPTPSWRTLHLCCSPCGSYVWWVHQAPSHKDHGQPQPDCAPESSAHCIK